MDFKTPMVTSSRPQAERIIAGYRSGISIVMGSAEDAQTAEATVNEVVSAFQGIGTL
jgi:hypothetical protein